MATTLTELQEKLYTQYSELDILELLDISTEDLVNAFSDRIEERYEYLLKEMELEE